MSEQYVPGAKSHIARGRNFEKPRRDKGRWLRLPGRVAQPGGRGGSRSCLRENRMDLMTSGRGRATRPGPVRPECRRLKIQLLQLDASKPLGWFLDGLSHVRLEHARMGRIQYD